MSNTAAHLVDRVLPAVPVRQWVLSLPFELRALAAFKADVLSALVRRRLGRDHRRSVPTGHSTIVTGATPLSANVLSVRH